MTELSLTDTEGRVLLELCKGDTNKEIANTMDITEATVKVHVRQILRKTRMKTRCKLIVAVFNGLIKTLVDKT